MTLELSIRLDALGERSINVRVPRGQSRDALGLLRRVTETVDRFERRTAVDQAIGEIDALARRRGDDLA